MDKRRKNKSRTLVFQIIIVATSLWWTSFDFVAVDCTRHLSRINLDDWLPENRHRLRLERQRLHVSASQQQICADEHHLLTAAATY